jgi:CARDB
LAFLDEDDDSLQPPVAAEPDDPRLGPPDRHRQILLRRLVAIGVGILILILLLLGIRGCLNARKERAFENYVRDLTTIDAESKQLSTQFFGRLQNPRNLSPLQVRTEIQGDRGAANGLVARAQGLDPPGELNNAQKQVVLTYELRRDGLTGVADKIGTALGKENRTEAIKGIALDMQDFLASDVLYRHAQTEINSVLADQGIDQQAPPSQFLPPPVTNWLDTTTITEAIGRISGASASSGDHGTSLYQTSFDGTALQPDTETTVTADGGTPTLEVQVQNAGTADESDVVVSYSISGTSSPLEGDETIPSIAAGEIESVKIPLDPAPSKGSNLTVDITVQPVVGESDTSNNESTYQVTYE